MKNVSYKLFWGVVIVGGLVAAAGFISERGIRIARTTPSPGQSSPQGRLPGDQRVRNGNQAEPSQLQQAEQGGSRENRRAAKAAKTEMRAEQGDQKNLRGTQRGHGLTVGQTPIPIIVNGKAQGVLAGRDLQDTMTKVTIATLGGARTGWAVSDLLRAHGVQGAKQVVFTDQSGKRWSAEWDQVIDAETRLIVAYSNSGAALLCSGPGVETSRRRQNQRQMKEPIRDRTDLVSFPNVVKIEVTG